MTLLRMPVFRRLAIGWTFSNLGDSVLYLTLAIWVKDLTHSNAAAGLVFLFLGLPVLIAPLAGQLADRHSRRRLAIYANLVETAVVLMLVFVHGRGDVWIIYAVTFAYGCLTYVTSAAKSGLVRDLLDDDQLASGNGLLTTIEQGLQLVSPLLGAGAYGLFGGVAVAIVTSSVLLVAAAVIATVNVVETPPADEREPFWPEVTAGIRHIRKIPVLSRVTTALAVAFLVTGFANTAVFAIVDQGLHRSSEFFGVLAAIQGAGSVLGGLTAAALVGRLGERGAMSVGLAVLGVGLGAASIPNTALVCVCVAIGGVAVPWTIVAYTTLRQRLTPATLQGRVASASNMAMNGPQTIGTAMGAALIAIVDYRLLVIAMGVVIAACAVPVAARRSTTPTSANSAPAESATTA
jgi:MFS family permease